MIIDNFVTPSEFWVPVFTTPLLLVFIFLIGLLIGFIWVAKRILGGQNRDDVRMRSEGNYLLGIIGAVVIITWVGLGTVHYHETFRAKSATELNSFYGLSVEENGSEFSVTVGGVGKVFDNPGEVTLMESVDNVNVAGDKTVKVERSLYGLYDKETREFTLYMSTSGSEKMTELKPVR